MEKLNFNVKIVILLVFMVSACGRLRNVELPSADPATLVPQVYTSDGIHLGSFHGFVSGSQGGIYVRTYDGLNISLYQETNSTYTIRGLAKNNMPVNPEDFYCLYLTNDCSGDCYVSIAGGLPSNQLGSNTLIYDGKRYIVRTGQEPVFNRTGFSAKALSANQGSNPTCDVSPTGWTEPVVHLTQEWVPPKGLTLPISNIVIK